MWSNMPAPCTSVEALQYMVDNEGQRVHYEGQEGSTDTDPKDEAGGGASQWIC